MNNPSTFGPLAEFFNVEGVPVTIAAGPQATPGMHCARWDDGKTPKPFDAERTRRNGAPMTHDEFMAHPQRTAR